MTARPPTPESVRRALAALDTRKQKIVSGLIAIMIQNTARVRDREWICEQLAEVALLAGEFEADTLADAVQAVKTFLETHAEELLTASYLLFQRVGLDLAPRAKAGFTYEDAMRSALEYLPAV